MNWLERYKLVLRKELPLPDNMYLGKPCGSRHQYRGKTVRRKANAECPACQYMKRKRQVAKKTALNNAKIERINKKLEKAEALKKAKLEEEALRQEKINAARRARAAKLREAQQLENAKIVKTRRDIEWFREQQRIDEMTREVWA